jgi:nitroimidazol reductase NimA-like FMN-containing flavoprotein (pyridoxamine 5'-phosphate oxidase superfamily)
MRKANREIKDRAELAAVFEECDVCRIGMIDDGVPYIVPMNFGFSWIGDALTLYFHCASDGRKLEIIARNPSVCFEMDCSHELKIVDQPCMCSMNYESIIGNGEIVVCEDRAEKIVGLRHIMQKYSAAESFDFPEAQLNMTTVLELRVKNFSGKRLRK